MGELQATIEVAVYIHKFFNVDLFQRGYYQLRVFLRSTPKVPTKVELSLPNPNAESKSGGNVMYPACVVNGAAVSKTFQILYRNEEVHLEDYAHFKLHLIVDSHKIVECLDRADLQLQLELWFTESSFNSDPESSIQCISSRTLLLHFSPTRGLHYHLPVLFDYFHLSAVTMTVHAVLVSLHQPYISGGKTSKSWSPKLSGRNQQSNMENVFFGSINSTVRCGGGSGSTSWRLSQARSMHRTICTLLLAANTALAAQLETLVSVLPPWAGPRKDGGFEGAIQPETPSTPETTKAASAPSTPQPTRLKLDNLSDVAKECYYAILGSQGKPQTQLSQNENLKNSRSQNVDCEEDFLVAANSDIAHLCAENILLWQHFLSVVSRSEPIRQHLARSHHIQRVKRFAEAFFVIDNPRPSASGCYDSNYQNYAIISETVRRSRYFALLPPLPIECVEVDGDYTTLPVVFEDQYQHVAEFARRRSIANRKSDNVLSTSDIQIAMDQINSPESRKRESNNPPDVTKPEPSPHPPNGAKGKFEAGPVFHLNTKLSNQRKSTSRTTVYNESHSMPRTVVGTKSGHDDERKNVLFHDPQITKYGTHPLKSQTQVKEITGGALKSALTVTAAKTNKGKCAGVRSRSSDSRVSLGQNGSGGSRHNLCSSESDTENRGGGTRRSRASSSASKNMKSKGNVEEDYKPPIPPRTDKMAKDFKPPIPPKLHILPAPKQNLKDRLKNNLKLELQLPPQGNSYKKAKFKVRLIQRAQQLRSNYSRNKVKKSKYDSNKDSVILLKYKRLEPSLSMPYNLGANTPGAWSVGSGDQLMRHSQSTLSMPSFLWDIANSSSGMAESLPDLLASESGSSSESQITHTHPPKSRPNRKGHILSNLEVGLASAADDTLVEVGKSKSLLGQLMKSAKVLSPTKKTKEYNKSSAVVQDSSSNSDDITSEQSGWVSNSSRESSGSSSVQVSPALEIKTFPIAAKMLPASPSYQTTESLDLKSSSHVDKFVSDLSSSTVLRNGLANQSPPLKSKSRTKEAKRKSHKPTGKENSFRSASNDQLQIPLKESPARKEVKKSQSLQKVNNPNKRLVDVYEQGPLPPPPKEFQDPTPLIQNSNSNRFGTTGRLPREERLNRRHNQIVKDRPRSQSPRTEGIPNGPENREAISPKMAWFAFSRHSVDFDIDVNSDNRDVFDEVFNDNYGGTNARCTDPQAREKFYSLPSLRKKHKNNKLRAKSEKRLDKKIPVGESDHLSDPIPLIVYKPSNANNSATDRARTHSAPPPNFERRNKAKNLNAVVRDLSVQRRSVSIPSKSEGLPQLVDDGCVLLELLLDQPGAATAWAQREIRKELLKEAQRVSKMALNTIDSRKPIESGVKRSNSKVTREKSRSHPNLKDSFDKSTSSIPLVTPKPHSPSRTDPKCTCPSEVFIERSRVEDPPPDLLPQKLNPPVPDTLAFLKAKEEFKQQINLQGFLYSDFSGLTSSLPYFHVSDDCRVLSPEGLHLVVCVHGLEGNSADLRLVKTYLEIGLPGAHLDFLMSERNQGDTFSNFETLTDRLVSEILYHLEFFNLNPRRISFIGHSLGNIIIRGAVSHPQMKPLLPKLHTFLSLSGPHLGTLYNSSGLVNMGMWFMQKWKKSGSLLQLALKDRVDVRQTFMYKLSQRSELHNFKNLILCGSSQDRYVPLHSARIELCRQAVRDATVLGAAYREMVSNLLQPIISSPSVTLVRFDIHHALPSTANSLIGRAAHIAVLDSELFIEKFLLVTGLKYFK